MAKLLGLTGLKFVSLNEQAQPLTYDVARRVVESAPNLLINDLLKLRSERDLQRCFSPAAQSPGGAVGGATCSGRQAVSCAGGGMPSASMPPSGGGGPAGGSSPRRSVSISASRS